MEKQEMINSKDLFGEQIKKVTTETFKSKKVLLWLPSGITTTPAWLFEKFTTSSLANHGIRRVSQGRRTSLAGEAGVEYVIVEYVIQLAKSDGVARISADTPITYLGFKKWK